MLITKIKKKKERNLGKKERIEDLDESLKKSEKRNGWNMNEK